jgi:F0F1-type ATP synthase membrane subunit c/vacuolar-type H+-ATPase subunit K
MKQPSTPGAGIAIGVAIGIAMGAALHNIGLGIALGAAFGAAFEGASRRRDRNRQETGDAIKPDELSHSSFLRASNTMTPSLTPNSEGR